MIEKGFESGGLSDEEIRELLREDLPLEEGIAAPCERPPEGEAPSASEGSLGAPASYARVLIVSRNREDVDLLRERLEARGAAAAVARNPFSALDRIRKEPFTAVISDLGLWANEGSLLIERTRLLEAPPDVFFVADAVAGEREEFAEILRRRGAKAVLFRPLEPKEVERFVERLASEVSRRAPAEPRLRASAPGPQPLRGEVAWLKFFFECRRKLRASVAPLVRLGILVEEAAEALGAQGAAVLFSEEGRPVAFARGAAGDASALGSLVDRCLGEERGSASGETVAGGAALGGKDLRVAFGSLEDGVRLYLTELPDEILAENARFLEELRVLLSEARWGAPASESDEGRGGSR